MSLPPSTERDAESRAVMIRVVLPGAEPRLNVNWPRIERGGDDPGSVARCRVAPYI